MSDEMLCKVVESLGRIEGRLSVMDQDAAYRRGKIDGIDERLRGVEKGMHLYSAIGGGLAGLTMTVATMYAKAILGPGGGS